MNNNIIPYGRQNITEEDIQSVVKALTSDYLTQGPKIAEFETAFGKYVGAKYAVAVSNGTAGLHLATLALNLKPGQKVITTSITFAASANCVEYCGGEVVFCDIDPKSYLIDLNKIREILESSTIPNEYVGIIPVDFAGYPVNLEALRELANEFGLWIIEDACHAPGAYFKKQNGEKSFSGSGEFADLAVFSFHPVKHIACGEGGMVTTNNLELYRKLITLRTHGITKDKDKFLNDILLAGGKKEYPEWYMEMQSLGFNYRLTDFQAALGLSQLSRANQGLLKRREIASYYNDAFVDKEYILGQSGVIEGHAYHLYIIEVKDRFELYNFLRQKGIYSQIHYFPCHLMPFYKNKGLVNATLDNAEDYYSKCISLPMYPTLSLADQNYVIEAIKSFYNG